MKKIKIAIADDQVLFLRAMVGLLNQHPLLEVVLQAKDGQELLELLEKTDPVPEIILLDLRMPQLDGLSAITMLKEKYPVSKVIVLTLHEEDRFITHMKSKGANGYLVKNSEPDEVYHTILQVHQTGQYFSDRVVKALHQHLVQPQKNNNTEQDTKLTKREIEILELICREFTMNEIAAKLSISLRTVEGHRYNLLVKTGAKNTAGLVGYAIKHNLYITGE